jgi:hypothetical protein
MLSQSPRIEAQQACFASMCIEEIQSKLARVDCASSGGEFLPWGRVESKDRDGRGGGAPLNMLQVALRGD